MPDCAATLTFLVPNVKTPPLYRAPPRSPPGAHKGSPLRRAATRERPYGRIPCGEDAPGRACWWRRRVVVGDVAPPFPARRPQGIAPTVAPAGACYGLPLRGACRASRGFVASRVGVRRCPAVPRQAPTRDRPYGCPCGACYGLPLRGACRASRGFVASRVGVRRCPAVPRQAPTRDRPYGCPCGACYGLPLRGACRASRGFVASRVGVRRCPAVPRQAPTRDRPYGGRPQGSAPTVVSPAGKMRLVARVGGVVAWWWATLPRRSPPGAHKGSPLRSYPLRGRCAWSRVLVASSRGGVRRCPAVPRQAPTRDRPCGARHHPPSQLGIRVILVPTGASK